jgi:hypothetical protein
LYSTQSLNSNAPPHHSRLTIAITSTIIVATSNTITLTAAVSTLSLSAPLYPSQRHQYSLPPPSVQQYSGIYSEIYSGRYYQEYTQEYAQESTKCQPAVHSVQLCQLVS